MEFKNQVQKETYEKVKGWMTEIFGEMVRNYDETPSFSVKVGSSLTYVNVYAWGDDRATIQCFSWVVTGADVDEELWRFLLRENYDMRFGAFGIDDDKDIFFKHSLMGNSADKAELKAAIMAVAYTADDYDDKIRQRWGGLRSDDR
ncbi:MAG: YbjN domain-containing protein [Roseiflexaceae bacterium]